MTPKEKAKELFIKYRNIIIDDVLDKKPIYFIMSDKMAKECALIAVDEILSANAVWYENSIPYNYWQKVKTEIEKL
jgi:hypothetical protein